MFDARKAFSAILMADGIYIFGGINGSEYLKSCEKFSFNSNAWSKIPPMNKPRSHFTCLRSPDLMYVYAIGGYNKEIIDSVER